MKRGKESLGFQVSRQLGALIRKRATDLDKNVSEYLRDLAGNDIVEHKTKLTHADLPRGRGPFSK